MPVRQSGLERFLSAARGEDVDCTPVWFMRQAGRYLPQYRELRKGYSIIEICKMPQVCQEVTLMPVKELGVDAAVMFADIMLPLEGMGVNFRIEENLGPVIASPIHDASSAEKLGSFEAERDVSYLLEAIRATKARLGETGTALVGFSGAPFTLASYLIEGQTSRDFTKTKKLMFGDSDVWRAVMGKLSRMVFDYLSAQIRAGADAVQLFDSWVGTLSTSDYARYVAPFTEEIFRQLASDFPDNPTIHFGTNTYHLLEPMKKVGGNVFSVDWRVPLSAAGRVLGNDVPIQGNLEPAVLLSPDREGFIATRTQEVIDEANGLAGHIFNLGHGMLRDTPVENAKYVVEYVHSHT